MDQTGKVKDEERIEIIVHGRKQEEKGNQVTQTKVRKSEFKQFDEIEDSSSFSGHRYYYWRARHSEQTEKRISDEWNKLKEGLPDSIFVRANKGRRDLLRAVIIGPQGTPYHDGLFFFDIQFPSRYPKIPPRFHLYSYGVVQLNLHIPRPKTPWNPSSSSVLELLLTAHAILVRNNELFTLDNMESIFKFNWDTMVSILKKPPRYFEGFVAQHFRDRAETILLTCKGYISERVNTPYNYMGTVKFPYQEEFDEMERCYSKLVTAFQKNGSSLADFSKLGIEFHGKLRTTTGGRIRG